ncbi:unnamed protein product [Meloidogyne enterolobii]|uniref:Uncharacterized protein n=1 Tax=Meloidogyne enterolobii TaxID=390850 RepID=A0ACB0ZHW4_MELEN
MRRNAMISEANAWMLLIILLDGLEEEILLEVQFSKLASLIIGCPILKRSITSTR